MTARAQSAELENVEVVVEGKRIRLTNLGKTLWPEVSFSKRQMISYYAEIAPLLLPHLRARPLTLKRFPDGVEGLYWFQTQCPAPPEWLKTAAMTSSMTEGKTYELCTADDLASLLWIANLAAIELHPLLSCVDRLEEPTAMVFDLDPGVGAELIDCCRVGLTLRSLLQGLGLQCFAKSSGLKGLHVYVPLGSGTSFGVTKAFARTIAHHLAEEDRANVIEKPQKTLRAGKVLIDWSQNDPTKSTVAPYSLRAARNPSVSTPLVWDEIEEAVARGSEAGLRFDAASLLRRVDELGDVFAPVLEYARSSRISTRRLGPRSAVRLVGG